MAPRDGGQVDVRFSVANAEVVRQALSMLGKDGEKALKQFDAAAKPIPKTTGLISAGLSEAQGQLQQFAARLGPVGSGLIAIGPAGLVAAGAIGAIVTVAALALQQVNALADRAGRLRDFGETAGLTVQQVQALTIIGAEVGVTGEKVESGIGRMVVALEELRRGSGGAYEQLRKINPALVEQLARTRDSAESIDLLAQAWEKMDAAQKAATSRAFFGRDLGMVRVFNELAQSGGLAALQQRLGPAITLTQEFAAKIDNLKDSSDRLRNSAWERFFSIGAETQLQNQREMAEQLDWISRKLKDISELNFSEKLVDVLRLLNIFNPRGMGEAASRLAGFRKTGEGGGFGVSGTGQDASTTPAAGPSNEFMLAQMRERNALLGNAITPSEQLKQKTLELAVATQNWTLNQDAANRGLDAFKRAQEQAAVSSRQQIGILTEQELIKSRLTQLDEAQAKGYIRNAEERARAEQLVRREIKETMDALEVRNSRFQGLTRLTQDMGNLDKSLDTVAVSGLNNMTSALTDIAMGTKSASDAFKNLALQVTRSVIEMVIRMQIALPIARALQSALGSFGGGGFDLSQGSPGAGGAPFASALGNVFGSSGVMRFARGGIVGGPRLFPFAGGTGLMGEAGPEAIMPLRRGRGGRLGVEMAGGSGAPIININIEDRVGVSASSERPRRNQDGSIDLDMAIDKKIDKRIGSGGADRSLRRVGAAPTVTRR